MGSSLMQDISFLVIVIIVHYAFYTNTILIIWCDNEDETNCQKNCDKGSYTVYIQGYTHTYVHT